MSSYACLFEAKSIQQYILRSGRLRHIVGASELIDSLTRELLDDALQALGLQENLHVSFSRRAGGAVYLFSSSAETRDRFRDLWALLVRQYAPTLDFIMADGEGENPHAAYVQAADKLQQARNRQPPWLPAGTPITAYAPRTGNPAAKPDSKLGLQDAATARFGADRFWRSGKLTAKFTDRVSAEDWPRNLDHQSTADEHRFPFLPDNRYLALIHADGNGLGQILRQLSERAKTHPNAFVTSFRDFSEAVASATENAVRRATEQVLLPHRDGAEGTMPARPIVLGGDDLTLLVRADLALAFTRAFLDAFEEESRAAFQGLDIEGLPEALTAGAGIAFIKSSHPFHLAHGLAESLAKQAKQTAKSHRPGDHGRIPPTIAWHRVTTASHGDYQSILEQEMTFGSRPLRFRTTLEVYATDTAPPKGLPALADLLDLVDLLGREGMARGPARQVLTLLGQDLEDARRRYQRWREVMADRDKEAKQPILPRFNELLSRLLPDGVDRDLPVSATGDLRHSPMGDIASLIAVAHGAAREEMTKEEASA